MVTVTGAFSEEIYVNFSTAAVTAPPIWLPCASNMTATLPQDTVCFDGGRVHHVQLAGNSSSSTSIAFSGTVTNFATCDGDLVVSISSPFEQRTRVVATYAAPGSLAPAYISAGAPNVEIFSCRFLRSVGWNGSFLITVSVTGG